MEGFSGIVRISNVSDFIEPSQKCIIPLAGNNINAEQSANLVGIHSKAKNEDSKMDPKKVKVTLSDCLACSGCITTAETMLVESQTVEQMLKGFKNSKVSVVTISPQSLTSLAVHFDVDPAKMAIKLASFFKSLGATYVVDSSFARILSRRLIYEEFRELNLANNKNDRQPLLTGICPGFVCYAEKTHGELLVPRISRVRSPQALTALLVKDYLRRKLEIADGEMFHVGVMPCYDKKLEASRRDFIIEGDVHEVDCVVTASELATMLSSSLSDLGGSDGQDIADPSLPSTSDCALDWLSRFGAGHPIGDANRESSGGYAEFVAHRLLLEFPDASLTKVQRNKDMEEFHVSAPGLGTDPVIVAKMYGFRNIQNAVQKLKRNKMRVDFAEVMACPSGCSNGGGQIRGESAESRAKLSVAVNDAYERLRADKDVETELSQIVEEWSRLNPMYQSSLHTEYHALSKSTTTNILTESW